MNDKIKLLNNKILSSILLFVFLLIFTFVCLKIYERINIYDYEVIIIEGEYDESNIS